VIVRHVLIGGFFTVVGLVSLLIPELPFICIGALIFGPIELMIGLFGQQRRPIPRMPHDVPQLRIPDGPPSKICGACGIANAADASFCTNCGTRFA
jgi:hypothetical protein